MDQLELDYLREIKYAESVGAYDVLTELLAGLKEYREMYKDQHLEQEMDCS